MFKFHLLIITFIIHLLSLEAMAQVNLVGKVAPKLGIEKFLQAPTGDKSLSALKGKVVVLEFWATWCAPCVAEIPHLNQLNEEFHDKPVQFISVTDEDEDVISPFLKRKKMKSWIGLDTDRSMFKAYGITAIPRTFLIDQTGKIAASLHPASLSSAMIERVIKGEKLQLPEPSNQKTVKMKSKKSESLLMISIAPTEKRKWPSMSTSSSKDFRKLEADGLTLHQALGMAYGFPTTRILGPKELLESWYTISVKLPQKHYDHLFQEALTASLEIQASNLRKLVDVLVLTAIDDSTVKLTPTIMGSSGSQASSGPGKLKAINGDISTLVRSLENVLEHIVVNETGIKGKYDWEILFDKEDPNSVLPALENRLGLRVRKERREIEFLVIEFLVVDNANSDH